MTLRPPVIISAALGAALVALAAPGTAQQSLENPRSAFDGVDQQRNWSAAVVRTDRGHLIGNPEAETRLIEFISYTCSHCATFAMEGEPAIDMSLLRPGKMAVEVRPVIRNALDLTVSLLVQCGDPAGFKDRHSAFMYRQSEWMAKFQNAPQSQKAIWARGDKAARMIAGALGLTNMLVQRGQSISDVNACVMDNIAAQKLLDNGAADRTDFQVAATPSFALDDQLLVDVHSWSGLFPLLSARFAPSAADESGGG
ncbi:thioredoxin domain-containing protein [Erythrobacter sp.]|uniref:DsbA family protein n=1 Tax=Erythrobacter sp. TaxID=1042 RepID=UPI0025E6E275|nr:thioredoxin domain-containing protein [Erythrobacter sp.]